MEKVIFSHEILEVQGEIMNKFKIIHVTFLYISYCKATA
jgi:hypothetical protein